MRIVVNGTERELPTEASLLDLLQGLGLNPTALVVEHNGQVVAREDHGRLALGDGDRLEIVRFVGGG